MLSATTVLNIVVVDVTDPPPSFTLSDYTFSVDEGLTNVWSPSMGWIETIAERC